MMTDSELLSMYKTPGQESQAYTLMLRQFQKQIYYYIRRMVLNHDDAADITQNTFIRAWHGLESFRAESKITTWLYRIAYNETLAFIRKNNRFAGVAAEDVEHKLGAALQDDELFSGDEMQRRLQVAIALLPEKQKAVFLMRYYDEMKYEDMSEVTGTSVGALKASYHHAVQKIEDQLKRSL
jgi:RNA polymerase sigma factor (sigma-70 family)